MRQALRHARQASTMAILALPFSLFALSSLANEKEAATTDTGETLGEVWTGAPGITETVAEIMARQAAVDKAGGPRRLRIKRERVNRLKAGSSPDGLAVSQWPPQEKRAEAAPVPGNPQAIGVSFTATDMNDNNGSIVPPDTMGDVGPTQVLMAVNGRIKVFDKAGNLGGLNADMDTFFTSVRNGFPTSDPHVRYDRLSQRWFVTIINIPLDGQGNAFGPNRILIAVSSGSAITNSASFTFFQFEHDDVGTPGADLNGFADYDTLGVDKFALYIGVNMFNSTASSFVGTTGYVVNKASLLDGGGFTVTAFRQLSGNTCGNAGVYTPQGVHNDDPDATEGYFIGVDLCLFSKLVMRRVSTPGGTPSISGNLSITQNVPSTAFPIDQVQPGGPLLDALDDRLYAASIHINSVTGAKTLWTAHNIEVNASGVGQSGGGRNGSRWYEIGSLTTTPAIVQAGTLFDSAAANPFGHWIPSVAANRQGHMALGASRASAIAPAGRASAVVAGRLRTDTAGTTQAATLAQAGAGTYDSLFGGTERWGDYSQVGVDPTDGQTMWTFQEFTNSESSTNSWGVRAIQLKAPLPATPSSASPSVAQGQSSVNVSITGTSSGGTAFFDPGPDTNGPGFTNHIAGAVSGGVTVNSTTFVDTTHVTLNVTTTCNPGSKNVTITNPDGQSSIGVGILTVPAITVNPTSLPGGIVSTAYPATTFTQTGGAGSPTFSQTGTLPTGMSFGGGCGTNTLCGTPTQVGTFPITVTATASGCQGSQVYNLGIGCQNMDVTPSSIAVGKVGTSYTQDFNQSGALGTASFTLFNVTTQNSTPPSNLSFNGTTGELSGTPNAAGSFPIIITVNDAPNNCKRDHAYTLLVTSAAGTGPTALAIDTTGNGVLDFSESSKAFTPTWFNNSGGSISPTGTLSGASSGLSIVDTSGAYGPIGNNASANCAGDCYSSSAPGPRPGTHWDATATETLASPTDSKNWTIHVGGSFADVTTGNSFYSFVETIFHKGITSGCNASNYCPTLATTREQMAVFLLRGKLGNTYVPPACAGIFQDVTCPSTFANFVEDLANRKITSGCSVSPPLYCPTSAVTRGQMAIFLLRALEGAAYVPPVCSTPPFTDVPVSDPFCPFIKEMATRGITSGCGGGNYCPNASITRDQMAVFLTRNFSLLLYGP